MKVYYCFFALLVVCGISCEKPKGLSGVNVSNSASMDEPIIFHTSLKDSLPLQALHKLRLQQVNGIKVQYRTGDHSSYFQYQANATTLLTTIAHLPFKIYASIPSDTLCRTISKADLVLLSEKISGIEYKTCSFFWSADAAEYDIYECIKAPFMHTVLIEKNSNQVLHRIQYLG